MRLSPATAATDNALRSVHASFAILAPDLATGVRAALATVVPFSFSAWSGRHEFAWMAIGGWLGTLVDPGGFRSVRAMWSLAFAITGSACMLATELAAHFRPLLALLITIAAFIGSMLRAFGDAGAKFGTLLAVVAAISASNRAPTPGRDALYFAYGTGIALLLSTVIWPIQTHRPLRAALASAFSELGNYARALQAGLTLSSDSEEAQWASAMLPHVRQSRAALESARKLALAIRARRAGESTSGNGLRVLLGLAERQFLYLMTLGEEIRGRNPDAKNPQSAQHLDELADLLLEVRMALLTRNPARKALRLTPGLHESDQPTFEELLATLKEDAEVAKRLALNPSQRLASPLEGAETSDQPVFTWRESLHNLLDAFDLESPILRHALRVTFAMLAAAGIAALVSPNHMSWVTVTTLIVLQPYLGATRQRAVERVIGTVLGSVLALLIAQFVHTPLALGIAMFPLSIAAILTRPRSFRLFTFFTTPPFLLLTAADPNDIWRALARSADSLIGGVIALIVSFLVLPDWERQRVGSTRTHLREAVTTYVRLVLLNLDQPVALSAGAVLAARHSLILALSNAEAALERLLAEPKLDEAMAEDTVQLISYVRRVAVAATALDTLLRHQNANALDNISGARLAARASEILAGSAPISLRAEFDSASVPSSIAGALQRLFRLLSLLGVQSQTQASARLAEPALAAATRPAH